MKKISVQELKKGLVFDQPVFIDAYTPLIAAKKPISEKELDFLRKWGIQEVCTCGETVGAEKKIDVKPPPSVGEVKVVSNQEKELLVIKIKTQYVEFQKNIAPFSTVLRDTGKVLEENFRFILNKKQPNSRLINDASKELAAKVYAFPLLSILPQFVSFAFNWTIQHLVHAACYGVVLAKGLGYSTTEARNLVTAMLLMDMGMFAVPSSIREKGEALQADEAKVIKNHTVIGYRLLHGIGRLSGALSNVALQHHEAYDGTGYPRGLKGNQIDKNAVIASICDTYTAMIERRPYRAAILPPAAVKKILANSAGRFGHNMIRSFVRQVSAYPIGSFVKISNGCVGMVVNTHSEHPSSPVLRLMRDENNNPYENLRFIDLAYEPQIQVSGVISAHSMGINRSKEI